jgi:23S rRNA pseudouridine2605 synthase
VTTGVRVQKVLARAGVASRRAAEALIVAGRVSIGDRVAVLGDRVVPGEEVRVDGRLVEVAVPHRTFALHKPRGVVSSASDDRARRTVLDLLPHVPGLHPVGRLDLDSEGLLLLTTDGELTLRLTHPRYGHAKTYRAWCLGGTPDARALDRLRAGVLLDDGWARAEGVRAVAGGVVLVLREGRKRQVRRMLAAVGAPVERLVRTHVGDVALGDLAAGAWRELGVEEVERLRYTRDGAGRAPGHGGARRSGARRRHP